MGGLSSKGTSSEAMFRQCSLVYPYQINSINGNGTKAQWTFQFNSIPNNIPAPASLLNLVLTSLSLIDSSHLFFLTPTHCSFLKVISNVYLSGWHARQQPHVL